MDCVLDWRAEKKKIVSLYKEGRSLRRIGEIYGVSHSTIDKRLSQWRIVRRGSGDRRLSGRPGKLPRDRSYVGLRLGHLTVMGKHPVLYPLHWVCLCSCGRTVNLKERQLRRWRSCGCRGKIKRGRRRKNEGIGKNGAPAKF